MATGSDAHRQEDSSNISSVSNLQSEIKGLTETAQQLLTDKLLLENEITQAKKRTSRLEEVTAIVPLISHMFFSRSYTQRGL